MKLRDVLAAKGSRVVAVSAKSSVADAIRTMHAEKVGAVLVPDGEGCAVGIFTERDVVHLFAEGERDLERLPVEAAMTCSIVVGQLAMSVDEALGAALPAPAGDRGWQAAGAGVDRRPGQDQARGNRARGAGAARLHLFLEIPTRQAGASP